MLKRYLENILHNCSEQSFGQEAVEWAIVTGRLKLKYELAADLHAIFDPLPDQPDDGVDKPLTRYDEIIADYQAQVQADSALLMESYAPLLEQIQTFPSQQAA
jgi:hypothetical protein